MKKGLSIFLVMVVVFISSSMAVFAADYADTAAIVNDSGNWKISEGMDVQGGLRFADDAAKMAIDPEGCAGYYGKKYQNEIFKFNWKIAEDNMYDDSSWNSVILRSTKPDAWCWTKSDDEGWAVTQYFFAIKAGVVEFQKWVESTQVFLKLYEFELDEDFTFGEYNSVETAAINTDGGVRVYLKLNGKMIVDEIDKEDPITDAGYFGFICPMVDQFMAIEGLSPSSSEPASTSSNPTTGDTSVVLYVVLAAIALMASAVIGRKIIFNKR